MPDHYPHFHELPLLNAGTIKEEVRGMGVSKEYKSYLLVNLWKSIQLIVILSLFALLILGCAKKNKPEINHVSVEKEVKLRGKIKTIALMPTYIEIREKGKDGKLLEIKDKQKEELVLEMRQILSSKGYVTAEFKHKYLTTIRQSNLVQAPANEISEIMDDFKAICYVIIANEYEGDDENYRRVQTLSIFPEGNYALSPEMHEAAKLTGADAVLFAGAWGYIEPKKATVVKTLINTVTLFFGIPFILLHSNLVQFDVAVIDAENGDVLWFNHGYNGFGQLLSEMPGRSRTTKGNEIYQ
ncbi:MAG TPA: hypothetical protein VHT73_13265 [Thermodesulfobacteriota bacterium]|nr:hypothetical protein [Thermodesulfobacteriota bacterium]